MRCDSVQPNDNIQWVWEENNTGKCHQKHPQVQWMTAVTV